MSESRIRIRAGEHEFDIEGPVDFVKSQAEIFRQFVWPGRDAGNPAGAAGTASTAPQFHKMVLIRGRVVFLTVPAKVEDGVLLVLLAQQQFRKNDKVTGAEVMSGLRESGIRVPRADSILLRHARDGNVVVAGEGRKRRYQLTKQGADRAMELVRRLDPLVR